jgi:hypothetical protein
MNRIGSIKDEFIRAADSFPKLAYVYVEWDGHGSAPEVPADFMFNAKSPSRNMIVSTPYGRGDDRMALSWLARPEDQRWQIEEARERLRQIVLSFSDFDEDSEWLFRVQDTLTKRKYRLFGVEDVGKAKPFPVGRRACRRAKPGEDFFTVVEDLFQRCAIACGDRAFLEVALNRVMGDMEMPDQNANGLGQAGGTPAADTFTKRFRTALSFPGERRPFVEQIASHLADQVGRERVLYDKYYEAELARVDLDTYLQRLYHDESELIVVFLCADYERKEWCGLEWRAIRDLVKGPRKSDVMFLRFDDTTIPGLLSIDGYVSNEF